METQTTTTAQTIDAAANQEVLDALKQHETIHKLRLGMDYHDGALWYGLALNDGSTCFLRSGGQAFPLDKLPAGIVPDGGTLSGPQMSSEGVRRFLSGESVDGAALIADLEQFFATHAKFRHPSIPFVLALWVIAGYLHEAFGNFAYLSITSPQRGCGKTKVLELLSAVAFRCKGISVNPTPAVLYRSLHTSAEVLVVDEFEKATDEAQQALIGILNAGFSRGATVLRCAGKDYALETFKVFGPKAFAVTSHDFLRCRKLFFSD